MSLEKTNLIDNVRRLSSQGLITQEELLAAYDEGQKEKEAPEIATQAKFSNILYYLGAGIVFIGMVVFIGQQWDKLNSLTRILVTLGSGLVAFVVGVLFNEDERSRQISAGFFLLSGLLIPGGIYITLDILGLQAGDFSTQAIVAAALTGAYLAGFLLFRKKVLLLFTIGFATWFYVALTSSILGDTVLLNDWRSQIYRTMVIFISYLCLGYYFSTTEDKRSAITTWLLGIGIFGFLGCALSLGGWREDGNHFWEVIFPAITFMFVYLSVTFKNRSFLFWSVLYLIAYLFKITSEYFSDSLGWALSLVVLGFLVIGVGFFGLYIHKKYLKS
ncbi:MAG: hypothetical protein A2351_00195 [Omnitrophica bacterium RIFOXYB12_FULL_50_7]|nr:MAG: hypothetical protein A2351_00195 [Omnitrophica bacterium RIFOXYB12_FULL_50_7]